LALYRGGGSHGFDPGETGEERQRKREYGYDPVRSVGVMQTQSSREPPHPSYWLMAFIPMAIIPWLAGIESIRRAHNTTVRRKVWRHSIGGVILVALSLLSVGSPFLYA
jgi:hypothetical protein